MKNSKQNNHKIFLTVMSFIAAILFFLFGMHAHGIFNDLIYNGTITINQISCFGHNNTWETFYYNCLIPRNNKQFIFSHKLTCRQQYWSGSYEDNYSEQTKKYISISSRKIDHITFTILIDDRKSQLYRSNIGGEIAKGQFRIVQDDDEEIVALRKAKIEKPFDSYTYEQIILLKNSGKGIMVYQNTKDALGNQSSINSIFFQCE